LYLDGEQAIYLEIQFKFYLYDKTLGETEIDHCIGPMRRDSLLIKLAKLREKQLPLLYTNETKVLLISLFLFYRGQDICHLFYLTSCLKL